VKGGHIIDHAIRPVDAPGPAGRNGLEQLSEHVYRYLDTCNVYVVKSGDRALLIDAGSGAVVERLAEAGIATVDWVLHTHHHRDQCSGDSKLTRLGARVGVPTREQHLFGDAEAYWQRLQIYDRYDCSNAYFTPVQSVPVSAAIDDYGTFSWEGIEFLALPTPGHTKGSVSYFAEIDGLRFAFCGDLIHSAGRLWTLHDLHWDYSNPDGLNATLHSAHVVKQRAPEVLAPSHGDPIRAVDVALQELMDNLRALNAVAGTRYQGDTDVPIAADLRLKRISEHLHAVTQGAAHFYVLQSRDGRVCFFDYGYPSLDHVSGAGGRFVEHSLDELRETIGIDRVDTVIVTHYHDDHIAGIPFLQRRFGTEVWTYEKIAPVLESPSEYRLPALLAQPIRPDRVFGDQHRLRWAEYEFDVRHCFGHTWYGVALVGDVDGRRIGVIGDEIQLDLQGRLRGGGPVYRNGLRSDSFTRSIAAIVELNPEILLTGHDGPLEVTRADLEGAHDWALRLEAAFHSLAADPDEVEFALDPGFVSVRPYEQSRNQDEPTPLRVQVRNHHAHEAAARVAPVAPAGWTVDPPSATLLLAAAEAGDCTFSLLASPDAAVGVRHVVTIDVSLGEHHFGEIAEGLVTLNLPETSRVRRGHRVLNSPPPSTSSSGVRASLRLRVPLRRHWQRLRERLR
jgi:glyoxylase-like metal-dependent hydrolase (beta-lactamase superfamily II)